MGQVFLPIVSSARTRSPVPAGKELHLRIAPSSVTGEIFCLETGSLGAGFQTGLPSNERSPAAAAAAEVFPIYLPR
jgi:hypothetical protein